MDPLVIFTPSGRRGRVARGTTVLQAARQIGVDLDSVCGGRGICSKCQVAPSFGRHAKHGLTVEEDALSPRNAVEDRYDEKRGLKAGRRLGCQAQILADAVLDVPPESQVHRQVVRKDADATPIEMDAATRLYLVEVREPDMHEPSGDLQRLTDALSRDWSLPAVRTDLPVLQHLQPTLRKGNWTVTAAVRQEADGARLVDLWPGFRETPLHGFAIDLGSTTIAAHLCALDDGRVVGSAGIMNPQIRFGEDLMSRVSHAMMNPGGAVEMTAIVRAALDDLMAQLLKEAGLEPRDAVEAVIVCNPVMHHLLLGIDPVELGQAPFALATSDALSIPPGALGLAGINPGGQVHLLPCVAGHVGADAAAVALAVRPDRQDALTLVVDVGTNAEILLGDRTRMLACSSPTGPAFEGAQISSGQRAAPGAIERVRIDPVTKVPRVRVIGCDVWSDAQGFDVIVTGICGSGIIEAVAEMRMAGLLDASGLIGSAAQTGSDRCIADGRTHAYILHDARPDGPLVTVTQGDIRAIQLAKSALYAGARLLMDERGVDVVDQVVLAGAFGAHISPLHAMVLGMVPDAPLAAVRSAGNAAGTGARIALCNRTSRAEVQELVARITKVETAVEPRFQEHFVAANAIPHATAPFPNLKEVVSLPEISFGAASGREGRRRRR
jgi:uncharacterized 2Fe-2S/4Fe-4S cluster protein (DUF4445 family)